MTVRPRPRQRRWLSGVLLAVTALALLSAPPAQADGAGLDVLGELAVPWLEPDEDPQYVRPEIAGLDADNRRLYAFIMRHRPLPGSIYLAEYDLATDIPTPVRISDAAVTTATIRGPYTAVIDRGRNRLLVASFTKEDRGNRPLVDVVDLATLSLSTTWELATIVPGFVGMGLTYDATADRLYLVGEFGGNSAANAISRLPGRPFGPGPAIVALDADSGALQWVKPLPGCRSVLQSLVGAFIARSARRPVLYTFCDGGSLAASQVLTGQNALLRVTITDDADAGAALDFPVEHFPVSGKYVGENTTLAGIVGFDAAAERIFAQSLSPRTAGGWVFDGLRSTWVGFVGAPDSTNFFLGVNPGNGRYYLAGYQRGSAAAGYINVTDGRSTPVAQGTTFGELRPVGFLAPDPQGDRLFGVFDKVIDPGNAEEGRPPVTQDVPLVLRDRTPAVRVLDATDYDALTRDLPDAKASLDFSAGASGFGARYAVVGGVEGGSGRIGSGQIINPFGLTLGDRGATLARIPRVDVRPAGASATAAAATVDEATESDRSALAGELAATGASDALTFPYGVNTCLDGNGERLEQREGGEGDLGRAAVVCDLARSEASGSAAFSEGAGAGGISVSGAAFDTRTRRDAKRGAVSESRAVAEGIALRSPSGSRVVINRITTTATTAANGRPGTAEAAWERTVQGVTVVDADGNASPLQSCTSSVTSGAEQQHSGDCDALARQINQALPTEMRVRFPLPTLTVTPRGAFAAVHKPEEDYLDGLTTNNDDFGGIPGMEAVVFNDGAEKSRLLVQFAAIRADAIFTRSPLPAVAQLDAGGAASAGGGDVPHTATATGGDVLTVGDGDGAPETGDLAVTGEGPVDLAPPGASVPEPAVAVAGGGIVADGGVSGAAGWLIGARTPADAAMAGGVWALFAAALAAAWRRRRLIQTLGG